MPEERRSHHRHACLVEVHGLHGERFFSGRAHNLSASGAFVECDTTPPRGEPVQLLFDVPPRLYRIEGVVVADRAGAPRGFAVAFQSPNGKVSAVARALAGEAREVMRRPVLRAHVRIPCEVRLLGAAGEKVFETTAVDISPGGAFLVSAEKLGAGTFLTVRFRRDGHIDHDAPAVVRWRRESQGDRKPAGLGVAFLRDEEEIIRSLQGVAKSKAR